LDGEEKKKFALPKELPSKTLTRKITWLRGIYKIKRQISTKGKKYIYIMKD
jgi:hypothetical protein